MCTRKNLNTKHHLLTILLSIILFSGLSFAEDEYDGVLRKESIALSMNPTLPITPVETTRQVNATDEEDVTVTIGTGTTNGSYPIFDYWWNVSSASLFTATEIGTGQGTITHLRWYCGAAATTWLPRRVYIYLKQTSDTQCSAISQNAMLSGATLVFDSGAENYSGPSTIGWHEWDISDFVFDGTSNLYVMMYSTRGAYTSSTVHWFYHSATNMHWQKTGDSSWDPATAGVVNANRPNIQMEIVTSPTAPALPVLVYPPNGGSGIPVNSALSWTTGANTNNWDVYFSTNQSLVTAMDPSVRVAQNSTSTTYDPPGNMTESIFYWRVVTRNTTTLETTNGLVWSFNTYQPLTGVKTIGGVNPDFTTFAQAISILQTAGVGTGGVIFSVRTGSYPERITVPPIPYTSATNTVRFQPESGAVTVNGLGTTSTTEAMITLQGCDYVTFSGINVQDVGTSSTNYVERGYWITNASATDGAWYNVIENCNINMTRANTSSRGIYQSPNVTPTNASGANSYNTWQNLKIGNCATYGAYIYGNTTFYDLGTIIRSTSPNVNNANRFVMGYNGGQDIGGLLSTYGFYIGYQQDLTIENIDVTGIQAGGASTTTYTAYGIYLLSNYGTINIRGNRIYGITAFTQSTTSSGTVYGMYFTPGTTPTVNVYNNFIYSLNNVTSYTTNTATRFQFAIYLLSANFNIYNNSMVVGHPTNYLNLSNAAVFQSSGNVDFRNNIVYNRTGNQTTATHMGFYRSTGTYTGNNNCFYITNPTNGFVGFYTTNQPTLANWQSVTFQDASSIAADPVFVDPSSDLHVVIGSNSLVNDIGQQLAIVTTDIDGETRSPTPDIGADEGDFALVGAPEIPTIVSPANGAMGVPANATLNWTMGANTANVDVYFSSNQSDVNSMAPGALVSSYNTTSTYDPPGNLTLYTYYYWRLVARNSSGSLTTTGPIWSFNTFIPVTGVLTIGGTAPDFPTFTSAINVLTVAGVGNGGVTFNVRPGNYPERITVLPVPNTSATNPVIFQRESGIVTVNATGTSGTTENMITLQGCDYVTFDGINVQDGGTSSSDYVERGYWITNNSATDGAWYNTIKNCTVNMTRSNTNSRGIFQTTNTTPTNASGANSYNTWENIKIGNVATYGGYIYGNSTFRDLGTMIRSSSANTADPNRFTIGYNGPDDVGGLVTTYGLYIGYQENFSVQNIDIRNLTAGTSTTVYSVYGLFTTLVYGNNTISGNRIFDLTASSTSTSSSGSAYGIYSSVVSGSTINIFNNFIYNLLTVTNYTTNTLTRYQFGLFVLTGNFNIYNNSLLIGHPTVGINLSNAAIFQSSGVVNFLNNIVYNRTGNQVTAQHFGYYYSSGTLTSNRNIYYLPNSSEAYVGFYSGVRINLSDWQSASLQDANSFNTDPQYVDDSTTDLHIATGLQTDVNNNASVVGIVSQDIDGEPRSPTNPDIGGDEGDFIADPNSPSNMLFTNVSSSGMTVNWLDNSAIETAFNLYYSSNGVNWTLIPLSANTTSYNASGFGVNTQHWWKVYAVVGGNETSGYASGSVWTFTVAPGMATFQLTGSGYSTAQVVSIDPALNPTTANYRIYCVTYNNWITAAGNLGASPRTATAALWANFNLSALPRGVTMTFYVVSVNGGGIVGPNGPTSQITTNDYFTQAGPDSSGYYYRTSSHPQGPVYSWINHTSHTQSTLTGDDATISVSLGTFSFPFYGTNYTNVFASTNGNIALGTISGGTGYLNGAVPTSSISRPAIFPYWDDFDFYSAQCLYHSDLGDGRFVFTYWNVPHNLYASDSAKVQIVLYSDGRILFQYQYVSPLYSGTIGIQGTAVTGSTNGMMYGEPNIYPNPNWAIMFYPYQPVIPPSIPTNLTVTFTGGTATLNWTASTGDVEVYRIYRHNTGYFTPPTSGTLIGTVPVGTTTYQDIGVSGIYYYRVTAYTSLASDSFDNTFYPDRNVNKSMFVDPVDPNK